MSKFSDLLRSFLAEAGWSERRLADRAALARGTLRNWFSGSVDKPRHWHDLVRVATALRLDVNQTSELLQAAHYPHLTQLWSTVRHEADRELLAFWIDALPTVGAHSPFQAIPDLPYFVGREAEIATFQTWLLADTHHSVYTLCGMAGVGKTALAAHLVYRLRPHFSDGVLWTRVDTTDTMSILKLLAAAYGHDVSAYTDVAGRSQAVRGILAHKRALLVLDNVESSQQVEPLLPPNGPCAVVITTRNHNLKTARGTPQLHVQPFSKGQGDALNLFNHILGIEKVSDEQATFSEIAKLLGHLPLALAIAAGRIAAEPALTASHLLQQLQAQKTRLDVIKDEEESICALFDVSYESLAIEQQQFFAGLGAFAGEDFTLEAAAAVNNVSYDSAVGLMAALNCRSLVQTGRSGRYWLHPLLHDYIREKIADPTIYQRLVAYFIDFLEQNKQNSAALEPEINNILLALQIASDYNLPHLLLRGVNTVFDYLDTRGLNEIAWEKLTHAAEVARSLGDITGLVTILNNLGKTAANRGNYEKAEQCLQEGLALARQEEDVQQCSQLLLSLGQIAVKQGMYDQAEIYYKEGLQLTHQSPWLELHSSLLLQSGILSVKRGDYVQAETYYQAGLKLARPINSHKHVSWLLQSLGALAIRCGFYDKAEIYFQEGLALAQELGYQMLILTLSGNMGVITYKQGRYAQSEQYYLVALDLAQKLGYREHASGTLHNLGELAARRGDYQQAKSYFKDSLVEARAMDYPELIATLLNSLASLLIRLDSYEEAVIYLEEALALAQSIGNQELIGYCLFSRGELKLRKQELVEAAIVFKNVLEIGSEIGAKELEAKAFFGLAQVALEQNDMPEARRQGNQSRTAFRAINHHQADEVTDWLQELRHCQ